MSDLEKKVVLEEMTSEDVFGEFDILFDEPAKPEVNVSKAEDIKEIFSGETKREEIKPMSNLLNAVKKKVDEEKKNKDKGTMKLSVLAYCNKIAVSFSASNPLSNILFQSKIGDYDKENNRRVISFDKVEDLQSAISDFENTYGGVREYFIYSEETIKDAPVIASSLNIMSLVEKEAGIDEKKLEELKEEKVKRSKKKKEGVVALEEQKKTFNEQIEQRMYESMRERILTDKRTQKLIFFNQKSYAYNIRNENQQKQAISEEMSIHGLVADDVESGWSKCLKSFPTYVAKDGREIKLSNHVFSFKVRMLDGSLETVYGEVKRNKVTNGYYISLFKAERKYNVQYSISSTPLSIEKITKLDGSKITSFDFGTDSEYQYHPKMDKTRDLYKYVFNTCFADEQHHKLVRVYWGSFFVRMMLQKALFNFGTGGDSKSLIVKLMCMLLEGLVEASLNLNTDYMFENAGIEDFPILSQPELKSKDYNEGSFKRFTGGDDNKAHVKQQDAVKFKFEKLLLIMNGNFNDTFVLNDTGNSMVRRIVCARYKQATVQIPNLEELLVEGGEVNDDAISDDIIEFEGGALEDLLDWMLIGAVELMEMRGFRLEKIGSSVVDFTNEMLSKMITNRNFFKEYELVQDEMEGVLEDDLYEAFLTNMRRDSKSYSIRKFRDDIAVEYKNKFGKEITRGRFNVLVNLSSGQVQMSKTILGVKLEGINLKSYRFNSTVTTNEIANHKNVVVDIKAKLKTKNLEAKIEVVYDKEVLPLPTDSDFFDKLRHYNYNSKERMEKIEEANNLKSSINDLASEIKELKEKNKDDKDASITFQISDLEEKKSNIEYSYNEIIIALKSDVEEHLKKNA